MDRVRLLLTLLVVVVVLAGAGAYAAIRHQHALPTVTCRDLLESAEVHRLPAEVVHDLDDPAFDVDVDALHVPPVRMVDDARHAMQREDAALGVVAGPEDALACSTGAEDDLLLVRREDVAMEHCYGPADACAGMAHERRTCADRFTLSGPVGRHHDLGCPDLG